MFGFLKEKLKSWLGKSKKDIEEKTEKEEKKQEIVGKPEEKSKEAEKKQKKEKKLKKVKTEQELKEERETTEEVIEDLKKEGAEIKSPEERVEELKEEKEAELEEKGEEAIEEKVEEKPEKQEKKGFFAKIKSFLAYNITEDDFNYIFNELELLLLESNVALEVVEKLKSNLKEQLLNKEIKKQDIEVEIKKALKTAIEEILIDPEDIIEQIKDYRRIIKEEPIEKRQPFKILFFGINGTGKTTSIAKFANLCLKNKLTVVLAAADTFRAASIEQIQIHADKLKIKLIKHDYGSDPSSVAFDAIKYAQINNIDVVLIDTAGRMHTKSNLLSEMEKICRVTKPNLKIFVAEAVSGNDATEQAKAFNEAIGINGSILSKVDVDEKGGTILSVGYITKKPILYLGVGQGLDDLKLFNKEEFLKNLGL